MDALNTNDKPGLFILRLLIFLITLILIFLAINGNTETHIIGTFFVLAIIVIFERYISYQSSCTNPSGQQNIDNFDNNDERKIKDAIKNDFLAQGDCIGQIYVKCNGCGGEKILKEHRINKKFNTMDVLNENYCDVNKIYCYNCGLDHKTRIELSEINYREMPSINGPPGYSVYLDMAYNY